MLDNRCRPVLQLCIVGLARGQRLKLWRCKRNTPFHRTVYFQHLGQDIAGSGSTVTFVSPVLCDGGVTVGQTDNTICRNPAAGETLQNHVGERHEKKGRRTSPVPSWRQIRLHTHILQFFGCRRQTNGGSSMSLTSLSSGLTPGSGIANQPSLPPRPSCGRARLIHLIHGFLCLEYPSSFFCLICNAIHHWLALRATPPPQLTARRPAVFSAGW